MRMARCIEFSAALQVRVVSDALPQPAAGEVLVQTECSAISAGTELLVYRGQLPPDMALDDSIAVLQRPVQYPLRYGYAAVGTVVACGSAVAHAWQGQRVLAFHPHASHFIAQPHDLQPVPASISSAAAALLPNMETAVNFLHDGQPLLGERVAVFGQGVVGLLTTALLAQVPLASLTTFDVLPERRAQALLFGATRSLDPLTAQLQAVDADLTYELSGNPAALDAALQATGEFGRVVVGSWYGGKTAPLQLGGRFHRARQTISSSQVSSIGAQLSARWSKARRLQEAWRVCALVQPERLVSHRFALEDAPAAYRLLDQQPAAALQVLLTY